LHSYNNQYTLSEFYVDAQRTAQAQGGFDLASTLTQKIMNPGSGLFFWQANGKCIRGASSENMFLFQFAQTLSKILPGKGDCFDCETKDTEIDLLDPAERHAAQSLKFWKVGCFKMTCL
jgi:hypothetical protein